jgi:8-oxo-dGTP pyrophosphatase MutT (NUDIX family)
LELPGGRIQKNSSIEETLKREVFEESGLTVVKFLPIDMLKTDIRLKIETENYGLILGFYLCEVENADKVVLSEEHIEYEWMSIDRVAEIFKEKFPNTLVEKIRAIA